jgi:hypothetical protein
MKGCFYSVLFLLLLLNNIFGYNSVMNKFSYSGFKSPAEDYRERDVSLDSLVIKNKLSTFILKCNDPSIKIFPKGWFEPTDILIVDRSHSFSSSCLNLFYVSSGYLLGFYDKRSRIFLTPDIKKRVEDLQYWGRVISVVTSPKNPN